MQKRLLELQEKFKQHLETVDAVALVVLKGHLLIEESLDDIIRTFVFHAECLDDARLGFAQKVAVAKSLSLDEQENGMWKLVFSINALRNDLAHSLQSEKREQKTRALVQLYRDLIDDEKLAREALSNPPEVVVRDATAFVLGFLATFHAEVERFRALVNAMDRMANPHRHKHRDLHEKGES